MYMKNLGLCKKKPQKSIKIYILRHYNYADSGLV